MAISLKEFWKLAIDSRLLSIDECRQLNTAFAQVPGARQASAVTLAEWLIANGVLSRYQTNVLLAGKLRPFLFGEYKVYDRHHDARLKRLLRAVHLPTGHSVSLYFFGAELLKDARQLAAALREGQAAVAVREDHLSRVFELAQGGSSRFVVLDDLTGTTLADYLAAQRVAPADACRVIRDLALAAAALETHGLAHGDIRPQNVWLAASGRIELLSYPLARDPGEPAFFCADESEPAPRLVAQADYLAPELGYERRAPTAASDVYSLGCLLYELLTGRPPFAGGDVGQKIARHAAEPAVTLDKFGMPPAIVQLVAQMMAKNPPVRLPSSALVAESLAPFANPDPTVGQPASPTLVAFERMVGERSRTDAVRQPTPGASHVPSIFGGAHPDYFAPDTADDDSAMDYGPGDDQDSISDGDSAAYPGPALAMAQIPASLAEQLADDIAPGLGRRPGRRSSTKGPPANPLFLAAAVLVIFAFGGVIAGLATRSEAPANQEAPDEDQQLAAADPMPAPPDDRPGDDSPIAVPAVDGEPVDNEAAGEGSSRGGFAMPVDGRKKNPQSGSAAAQRRRDKPAVKEVDDDGKSLWTSPTAGAPVSLRYLPAGAEIFLIVRPAELLASAEGAKMVEGLGPAGQAAKDEIKTTTGFGPEQIEQLIVGFYPDEMRSFHSAWVVRLNNQLEESEMVKAWQNPDPAEAGGKKYYQRAGAAYYVPPDGAERVFAVMPPGDVEDAAGALGPPLGKELEKLLSDTDDQRQFTLLATPSALFASGKSIFVGELDRLQGPLERFFGEGARALLFSLNSAADFFLELRVCGQPEDDPRQLATRYHERLNTLPTEIEDYLATLSQQPYSAHILLRFPNMLRLIDEYTRTGEERRQAVLRCYLPANAGHNLVMATELALFARPGAGAAAVKGPGPQAPATVAEALNQKTTLSFNRDTLEKSMDMLSKEIGYDIVILGNDLQLDGITKNQSFPLDERDKPAGEILRSVLKLANPDGKLVYVIKPKEGGGKETIFITTRSAVEKRGDKLPPELAGKK